MLLKERKHLLFAIVQIIPGIESDAGRCNDFPVGCWWVAGGFASKCIVTVKYEPRSRGRSHVLYSDSRIITELLDSRDASAVGLDVLRAEQRLCEELVSSF